MKVYRDISLKAYNTFGIAVKTQRLVVMEDDDDVALAPILINRHSLVLGAGSDTVFTRDFDGTVVTFSNEKADGQTIKQSGNQLTVWAGMKMDDLVQWTLDHGLYGLENLSAIPGTVGAAVVQNVGAYGAEAKDTVVSVEVIDLYTGDIRTYTGEECRFGYRTSRFKEETAVRELVVYVTFALKDTYVPNLSYKALEGLPHESAQQMREAITALRWTKLPRPEEHGSAGSFFKNPVVDEATYMRLKSEYPGMPEAHKVNARDYKLSAGWLIDKAGWKGKTMGRVGVWPENALVLYNLGGCTGDEVVALANAIQADVEQKFGIALSPEAIII